MSRFHFAWRMWKSVGLAFLLLLFGAASANYAQEERILSFHSDVHVKEDGKLEVTETIRVIANATTTVAQAPPGALLPGALCAVADCASPAG